MRVVLRTNTKDGLPVTSPRGLLDRLNLRQILAQRFVFSIRPGKTFHLSASPKNIAAASLDPQIMPLSGAQREISDWSIERKHFRASPFAPRYLSSHKHQADILTLFWWRLKYNMIGKRGSPHGPISLLSVPPIFGHSMFSFCHQWKLFFSGSHIILWHLNVNRFWFSQAGLSFHIYLSICFTCPDIWQLYSQRLQVSPRCNMSSDQHTITVIKSGQTVLTGHSHNHKRLCQIKPSNWSQSQQGEWGMSLEILICLDHRAQPCPTCPTPSRAHRASVYRPVWRRAQVEGVCAGSNNKKSSLRTS